MTTPGGPNIKLFPLASQSTLQYWWKPPTEGGADVTEYELTVTPGPYTFRLPGGATYCTVEGLSDGAFYSASIRATCNYPDWGPSSVFYEWQPGLPPSYVHAPQTPKIRRLGWTTGIVTWKAPLVSPSTPILWYVIRSKSSDSNDPELTYSVSGHRDSNCYIEGMNPYSSYYFTVEAVNTIGYSPPAITNTAEGVYLPSYVNGIQVWLDAQDSNTITLLNSRVSQWNDKSGNNYNATPAESTYPLYSSNTLNSLPCVNFDYDTGMFIYEATGTYSSYVCGFLVYQSVDTTRSGFFVERSFTGTAAPYIVRNSSRNRGDGVSGSVSLTNGIPNLVSYTNPTMYNFEASGSFWKDKINTSVVYNNTASTAPFSDTAVHTEIFTRVNTSYVRAKVGEYITYNRYLPPFILERIEGYIAWRWGLVSRIPTTHPFYSTPPWADIGFAPTNVSGLKIWYDGADPYGTGEPPMNGDSITTWVDKSGLSNDATAVVPATYVAATDNSPGFLNFNGIDTKYNIQNTSFINNKTYMLFIVEKVSSYTSGSPHILSGSGGTAANLLVRYTGTSQLVLDYTYSGTATVYSIGYYGSTHYQPTRVWSLIQTATKRQVYINGIIVVDDTWGTLISSWAGAQIGAQGSINYYKGNIKELILIVDTPDDDKRKTIEAYLTWKWGAYGLLNYLHPYKTINPYSSFNEFLPFHISNLTLWLDASDENSIVVLNTNKVSLWVNKASATDGFAQNTDGNRPTRIAYGSSYAIQFSGSTFMDGSTMDKYFTQETRTILVVGMADSITTNNAANYNGAIIGTSTYDPGRFGMYFVSNGGSPRVGIYNNDVTIDSVTAPYTLSTLALINYEFTVNNLSLRLNGGTPVSVVSGKTTTNYFTTSSVAIGRQSTSYYFQGKIMEVLIYSTLLTPESRQKAEGYLAWKWGLQNTLPTDHPYKLAKPTGFRV